MYEVFLKSWYQEVPDEVQDESILEFETIDEAFEFLKINADHYMEFYPLVEMGIRLKKPTLTIENIDNDDKNQQEMKESILEFKEKKVRVKIPKHIEIISNLVNHLAEITEGDSDEFTDAYDYLENYYEETAKTMFRVNDISMDGFFDHNSDALDYCKFSQII